ncbi:hypothetical protein A7982_12993 [Minicystis rosea]|nr:hypothetical protein A7982_12993 [Minicystis rosea]
MKRAMMTKLGCLAMTLLASACQGCGPTAEEGAVPEGIVEPVGVARSAIARFALTCIKNATGRGINYDLKWGDGPWTTYRVEGNEGSYRWHSKAYAVTGEPRSPELTIRFDSDMTDGTSYVEYSLKKYAAPEESCELGKIYRFEWDGSSKRYIDLKSVN